MRIRSDYVFGTTSASLTDTGTTLSSAGLARLPVVASPDYAAVTLNDPATGDYEVVYVTAHTASATTATIVRGREGSTAAAWASGSAWHHGATSAELRSAAGTGAADNLGAVLAKQGVVLTMGTAGDFDEDIVESPAIMRDPKSGRYVMTYTGYDTTPRARAGYAYSDDLVTWTKAGVLLPHSGVASSPDENGVTGPVLFWDNQNSQYVLYYIGLTATGYEGGTKSICYATATSLSGTWTRHGAVVTTSGSGWRQSAVWHVSIVEREGRWYMFFNATGSDSKERIGYATAPTLVGPWTVDDTNSPLIDVASSTWESTNIGDPSVRRVGDMWVMDYYGFNGTAASDGIAVTSDAAFPLGWVKHPNNPILSPSETYDAKFAHKPFVIVDGGKVYHYYTAVATDDTRQIALATSSATAGLTVQDENGTVATGVTQIDFQGAGVSAASGAGEVTVTVPGATGGTGFSPKVQRKGTTGTSTVVRLPNSTTFVALQTGAGASVGSTYDLVLPSGSVSVGDTIECGASVGYSNQANDPYVSFGSVVSSSIANIFFTGSGIPGLWATAGAFTNASGSDFYVVQTSDLSAGSLTIRPLGRTSDGNFHDILAGLFVCWVKNWGPQ